MGLRIPSISLSSNARIVMSRAGSVFEEDLATPGAARHALTLS